ncbi:MAG: FAA hydrolase family protein, partial [Proteobacteria bacterium]
MDLDSYVISPAERPSLAVRGDTRRFPIRRILCVGRNYAAHAREMGSDPDREPPFFFSKPADAITSAATVPYPSLTSSFHHEVELVVAMATGGRDLDPSTALEHVFGYGVGIDLTRRDLQEAAKSTGRPWDFAKGFDLSAPCSDLVPVAQCGHPAVGAIWLSVNDTRKQEGDLADMIWSVPEVIAAASRAIELAPGDLIYTGTPSGVGPLVRGDRVECHVAGVGELRITIA